MRRVVRIGVGAMAPFWLAGCSPDEPPIEANAADLYAAYLKNAPAADQQYRGHTLVVTGISGGIDSDGSGYVLTLVPGVRAHLGPNTAGANLLQRVTVRCRNIRFVEAVLDLAECEISSATAEDTGEGNIASSALASHPSNASNPADVSSDFSSPLDAAFEAATGHRAAFSTDEGTEHVVTRPLRILSLPFGKVLLTERKIENGCHACSGAIGVYYLREHGGRFSVTRAWPKAIEGGGFGFPPANWRVTDEFAAYPAIYGENDHMGQGLYSKWATLTELSPTGFVTSGPIDLGSSNEGAVGNNEVACVYEGEIVNIQKNKSFDVRFTGSMNGTARYVKKGAKFVLASEPKADATC